jgi:hypothetical protein
MARTPGKCLTEQAAHRIRSTEGRIFVAILVITATKNTICLITSQVDHEMPILYGHHSAQEYNMISKFILKYAIAKMKRLFSRVASF